ncbi:MAG TPA: glycosyltransferase [Bacteroidota bacterium]|nr:glycosyltransferase [Bacteroidota bacterium]
MVPVVTVLNAVEIASLSVVLLFLCYLLVLTVLAGRVRIRDCFPARLQRRFAVVVPAHNEEHGIGQTVKSILAVEYPADRFDAVVIADNCTDDTASRATEAGAKVLERHEPAARGKGYALRWGFDRLPAGENGYDAVVVIDADSVVSANYLTVLNWYLEQGSPVLQTSDLVQPGNDAWNAQMTRIGFLLYNYVRPLGRKLIGGTAGLRGNGMCFSTRILSAFPWNAYSITEDLEYGLTLLLRGIKVTFTPEATVFAVMPRDPKNAEGQRARWEGGRIGLIRRYSLPLLKQAARRRSLACLDAFLDLVVPALVNLVGFVLLAAFVTLSLAWLGVQSMNVYTVVWIVAAGMGITHLVAGLSIAPADRSLYRALLQLPRYALWKVLVYSRMRGRWSKHVWTRTTREIH